MLEVIFLVFFCYAVMIVYLHEKSHPIRNYLLILQYIKLLFHSIWFVLVHSNKYGFIWLRSHLSMILIFCFHCCIKVVVFHSITVGNNFNHFIDAFHFLFWKLYLIFVNSFSIGCCLVVQYMVLIVVIAYDHFRNDTHFSDVLVDFEYDGNK